MSCCNLDELATGLVVWLESTLQPGVPNEIAKYFHYKLVPDMTNREFILRCFKYVDEPVQCSVIATLLISKLIRTKTGAITEKTDMQMSIHAIFSVALLVAIKLVNDDHYDNARYARVFGIETSFMNTFESRLLCLLDWDLRVSVEAFNARLDCLLDMQKTLPCYSVALSDDISPAVALFTEAHFVRSRPAAKFSRRT